MEVRVCGSKDEMGAAAAARAAEIIRGAIAEKGAASIVTATGASQFEVYEHLVEEEVEWGRVTMFHLDEYIGLGIEHPASFRGYLKRRFLDRVGRLAAVHLIDGESGDPEGECGRLGELISRQEIDLTLAGIGENGHLAFNDPPADFGTTEPYLVVRLDERCRRQQLGEGWFESLEAVPERAISMSIHQIMKSGRLILSVPDERKAEATRAALEGEIGPMCPASIVRRHPGCEVFLDRAAAALLGARRGREE